MSEFMSYDPWAEITTRNGYAGDEMVAMLQKAIRRGKEEDALHAAYEMYITSPQFEEKLWRRLLCISVEDIGFGNPDAPNLVYTLFKMRQEFHVLRACHPLPVPPEERALQRPCEKSAEPRV